MQSAKAAGRQKGTISSPFSFLLQTPIAHATPEINFPMLEKMAGERGMWGDPQPSTPHTDITQDPSQLIIKVC